MSMVFPVGYDTPAEQARFLIALKKALIYWRNEKVAGKYQDWLLLGHDGDEFWIDGIAFDQAVFNPKLEELHRLINERVDYIYESETDTYRKNIPNL